MNDTKSRTPIEFVCFEKVFRRSSGASMIFKPTESNSTQKIALTHLKESITDVLDEFAMNSCAQRRAASLFDESIDSSINYWLKS